MVSYEAMAARLEMWRAIHRAEDALQGALAAARSVSRALDNDEPLLDLRVKAACLARWAAELSTDVERLTSVTR